MGTITDKLQLLAQTKAAIKTAIIRMGQPVADNDPFSSYADKITSIKTGVDTSDATAAAGDILDGKVAYAKGQRVVGTIPSRGAGNLSASGATVTGPAGYYPAAISKSVSTATQATPAIAVSSNGLITASAVQSAGYVSAGTKSATKQMTVQAVATITPGTAAKTACPAGRYTTGNVTVAGDTNLKAENIKSGVSIFGVAGTARIRENVQVAIVNNTSYSVFLQYARAESGADGLFVDSIGSYQTRYIQMLQDSIGYIEIGGLPYARAVMPSGDAFSGSTVFSGGNGYVLVGKFSTVLGGTILNIQPG